MLGKPARDIEELMMDDALIDGALAEPSAKPCSGTSS